MQYRQYQIQQATNSHRCVQYPLSSCFVPDILSQTHTPLKRAAVQHHDDGLGLLYTTKPVSLLKSLMRIVCQLGESCLIFPSCSRLSSFSPLPPNSQYDDNNLHDSLSETFRNAAGRPLPSRSPLKGVSLFSQWLLLCADSSASPERYNFLQMHLTDQFVYFRGALFQYEAETLHSSDLRKSHGRAGI